MFCKENIVKITFCMYQIITGGIEKSLISLLNNLSKFSRYEFTIVVEKPIKEQIFLDFFSDKKIKVYVLGNKKIEFDKKRTNFLLKFIYKLINKFYRKQKAHAIKKCVIESDLIIDYFNCSFCDLLRDINKPKIGWYHSGFTQYEKHVESLSKKYAEVYDKFVVITKSFKSQLSKNEHIGNKVVQIYNPFNISTIKERAGNTNDYPKDEKYFTFVGRFHEDKDHQTVIDAFEIIVSKYPKVKIYFIGDGDTRKHYEYIVQTKKLEKNIIFTGTLDNPFGYIKHATANILSSPSEGLSNVLVEGAILETLNISSNCPSGPAEILLDGKAGILYPVGDSKRLAQIIGDILENKINRKELIENANNKIQRFDVDTITQQFIDLCNNVVKQRKKIGIVNFFFENENYGAVLTAYALNKYLSDLGYSATNINYTANFYKARNVKDASNFIEFKKSYLPMTPELHLNDLASTNNDFDVFIVGSDQVFRHSFIKKEKGVYYLSFVNKNRKKIAYAASFGISHFDGKNKDKKKVKSYLKSFNAISVREADGINILRNDFEINGTHVLDPVFMINWDHLITDFKYDEIVYYILNPDLKYLAQKNMLGSPLKIEEWISAIKNANLVVTDSFHGICFCLLFKKQFVALAHRSSPISRLYSLFDMFSISREKIIFHDMEIDKENMQKYAINPAIIDDKLTKWQEISKNFIKTALGD